MVTQLKVGILKYSSIQNITLKTGIERVQALADISRSALCCHSNETRAPIANPPNSVQREGTRTTPHVTFPVRIQLQCETAARDRQTGTQTAVTNTFRLGCASREM